MSLQIITFLFESSNEPLDGRYIHANELHGLLYNITAQTDREETDWLHQHSSPRPFALVPLYTDSGLLVGLRLSTFTVRAADLFSHSGEWFRKTGRRCHLGGKECIIKGVQTTAKLNWPQLTLSEPAKLLGLRFLSPTVFKQGPGLLPLPLPVNVFRSPYRIWQAFGPPIMHAPFEWLDWCDKNVFIKQHSIETVQVKISQRDRFLGFVGEVWFGAHEDSESNLRFWQALGTLATFCGVGHKTTMGMGSVELLINNSPIHQFSN